MRERVFVFVAALSLSALVAFPSPAYSICGCDPAAGTLGLDRPSASSLRVAVEDRYLSKESGGGEDAESEREDRLLLRAQYSPLAPLVLQVEVPYFLFKNHLNAEGLRDDTATGLGDVTVGARYELLRVGLQARHVVALTGTLKMPTGPNARHLPGEDPDEHLQLGTGSWDGLAGISYLYGLQPYTVYANATTRLNTANGRGFRYGHAVFGTLGTRRSFLESQRLVASLEAQARFAGRDHFADGSTDPDSGGFVGYAAGSIGYALTQDLLLRAVAQVPVVKDLNGIQNEHPVLYLNLAYDFAM
jgi:Putative MetA-pathway of phenol degradation